MKSKNTTLLSYFRDAVKAAGNNAKYLNRDFLAKFCAAYYAREKAIQAGTAEYIERGGVYYIPEYDPVYNTEFYTKNGGGYCLFLEIYAKYRAAMDRI